jgi:hypothetical protein
VKRSSLSIVLPVQNAADRLPALVAEALALGASHAADYELILALDGADGATERQALSLAATHAPVALIRSSRRGGFRAALLGAWAVARGDTLLVLDHQQVAVGQAAKLLAAPVDHAVVLGYRTSADPRPGLAAMIDPGRAGREPRDSALRLALVRAELRHLLDPQGPEQLLSRELFSGARRHGLTLAQVAVAGKAPAGAGAGQRGAAVGLGMLVVAGALWMLRRWLPQDRQ